MLPNYVILLTGSITPSKKASVVIKDPRNRLQQYCEGIQFWNNLDLPSKRLLFIDNSGYGKEKIWDALSDYTIPYPDSIDIISEYMNEIPEGLTYGFAELAIIDFALTNLSAIRESNYFIKATGRLTFPHIKRLLQRLPNHFLFAVDTRENTFFVRSPQRFVTTQLMIFNTRFYINSLMNIKQEMNQEINIIEKLFYEKLLPFKKCQSAILRWPVSVDPSGQAAHFEKNYDSKRKICINIIRNLLRTYFPNWWV